MDVCLYGKIYFIQRLIVILIFKQIIRRRGSTHYCGELTRLSTLTTAAYTTMLSMAIYYSIQLHQICHHAVYHSDRWLLIFSWNCLYRTCRRRKRGKGNRKHKSCIDYQRDTGYETLPLLLYVCTVHTYFSQFIRSLHKTSNSLSLFPCFFLLVCFVEFEFNLTPTPSIHNDTYST